MKTFYSLAAAVLATKTVTANNDKLVCTKASNRCSENTVLPPTPNGFSRSGSNKVSYSDTTINAALGIQPNTKCNFENFSHPDLFRECLKNEVSGKFGLQFHIPVINNYGCWCYGGDDWPGARDWTGFGPTMDEYDDACKAHHMGFDCIVMDAEVESEVCDPTNTSYSLGVTPLPNGDYVFECDDSIEDDWCKRRTCMVDLRFIARHWKLEDDGVEPDFAAYGHAGYHDDAGDFDAQSNDSVCILPRKPGGTKAYQKVCCGDYPYRVWFDQANGRGIECCAYEEPSVSAEYGFTVNVGKLFNSMAATCCDYGVITDGNVC